MVIEIFAKHPGGRTRKRGTDVRYVYQPKDVGPRLSIWLAAPPSWGSRYLCVVMCWSYLTKARLLPSGSGLLLLWPAEKRKRDFQLAISTSKNYMGPGIGWPSQPTSTEWKTGQTLVLSN